jgi:3-phenylpropionate/trans-cinnamate dioxygenase ferredoxin component
VHIRAATRSVRLLRVAWRIVSHPATLFVSRIGTGPAIDAAQLIMQSVSYSSAGCIIYNRRVYVIPVCELGAIPSGEAVRVDGEVPIAVFNADGKLYAIDDTCTHQDASLADGWLEGCVVECPLHGSCFDLRTGQVSGPPAKRPVRTHRVVVLAGMIYVQPSGSAGEAA